MVQPATPQPGTGAASRPTGNRRRAIVGFVVGFAAVLLAFLLASFVAGRAGDPDRDTSERATSAPGAQVTAVTGVDGVQAGEQALIDPAFRIHPQRARVPDGGPVELQAFGDGCAGGSGELSVSQVGEATSTEAPGRLVLRRRFDVGADGTWEVRPLLVDQPEGSYRVSAACERRPRADGLVSSDDRRDLFIATEVLELTGMANQQGFDVEPRRLEPNTATVVRLIGSTWCPNATVQGTVFANSDSGVRKPFGPLPVNSTGDWQTSVVFSTGEAVGSYSVEATCSQGFAFSTETIQFVPDRRLELNFLDRLLDRVDEAVPATPVRGIPTFTD